MGASCSSSPPGGRRTTRRLTRRRSSGRSSSCQLEPLTEPLYLDLERVRRERPPGGWFRPAADPGGEDAYHGAANAQGLVCVTGASGFIGSHVVAQLLARGYAVNGTVRDTADCQRTAHLLRLPGAERLRLFQAELACPDSWESPLAGCVAVVHTANPVSQGGFGGEELGMDSILGACERGGTVRTFVLLSSMSAVAPVPEPEVKHEAHWSSASQQKSNGNWYGAAKTELEQMLHKEAQLGTARFRIVAICPTVVLGPRLGPRLNASIDWLRNQLLHPWDQIPNGTMSFVDVRDVAAQLIAGIENPEIEGRYMSVVESLHWNEVFDLLKELYPAMPDSRPCQDELASVTRFDLSRRDSLGVDMRSTREIFSDAVKDLIASGDLDKETDRKHMYTQIV